MTYAIQDLVIRNVEPVGAGTITDLLAEAVSDGPVARWLEPDPVIRHEASPHYFQIFVEHAVRHGEIYAAAEGDTGRLTGVALWFPLTSTLPSPDDYECRLQAVARNASDPMAVDRACLLDAALAADHPVPPHHYLGFLAVRPGRRGRGVGSALLDRHHDRLDAAGLPAYVEASNLRDRDLYLRHGYRVRSVIELPDGPLLWTMWRSPMK